MRKSLSLLLSVLLSTIIGISPINATVNATKASTKSSYTVLILDFAALVPQSSEPKPPECYFNNRLDNCKQFLALERFIYILKSKNRLDEANIAVVLCGIPSDHDDKKFVKSIDFSHDCKNIISQVKAAQLQSHADHLNFGEGLVAANKLLENIQDESAEKNIILFSCGWNRGGNHKSTGHYSNYSIGEKYKALRDESNEDSNVDSKLLNYNYSLNSYMNCVYDEAQKIKNSGTNIYVMHSFNALSKDDEPIKDFNLLQKYFGLADLDLASSKNHFYSFPYTNYDDPGTTTENVYYSYDTDINIPNIRSCCREAIEEIANKIAHNEDYPIVIVPGIMGSRLFRDVGIVFKDEDEDFSKKLVVWPPTVQRIIASGLCPALLNYGKELSKDNLRIRPCENQNIHKKYNSIAKDENSNKYNSVELYGREYGALDTYKKLVEKLCSEYSYKSKKYREVYFFSYDWRDDIEHSAELFDEAIKNILHDSGCKKVDIVCHSMGGLIASKYFSESSAQKRERINKVITCATPYEGSVSSFTATLTEKVFNEELQDNALWHLGKVKDNIKSKFKSLAQLTPSENYLSEVPMTTFQKKIKSNLIQDLKQYFKSNYPKVYTSQDLWSDYEITTLNLKKYEKVFNKIFNFDEISPEQQYEKIVEFQNSLHASENEKYNILLDYDKAYFAIGMNQKTIKSLCFISPLFCYPEYENKGDGTVPYLSASIMNRLNGRCWRLSADHVGLVEKEACLDWILDILNDGRSEISSDTFLNKPYLTMYMEDKADICIEKNGEILSSDPENPSLVTSFGRLDLLPTSDGKYLKCLCVDAASDYKINLINSNENPVEVSIKFFNGDGTLKESTVLALESINNTNFCEIFNNFITQNLC